MKCTHPRGHAREEKSPQAIRKPHHHPPSSAGRLGCAGRACHVVRCPCGRCGGEPATSCNARWAMRRRACHVVRCPCGRCGGEPATSCDARDSPAHEVSPTQHSFESCSSGRAVSPAHKGQGLNLSRLRGVCHCPDAGIVAAGVWAMANPAPASPRGLQGTSIREPHLHPPSSAGRLSYAGNNRPTSCCCLLRTASLPCRACTVWAMRRRACHVVRCP